MSNKYKVVERVQKVQGNKKQPKSFIIKNVLVVIAEGLTWQEARNLAKKGKNRSITTQVDRG